MKGYQTMKQFVQDYRDFILVKKMDPGRDSGETVTKVFRKIIDGKLQNASKGFKAMMEKNGYSLADLKLIALHDSYKSIDNFEDLIAEAYEVDHVNTRVLKRFLSSNAFKKGRLEKVGKILPFEIRSKKELKRFLLLEGREIAYPKLKIIMKHIASKGWEDWLEELIEKEEVYIRKGRFSRG